MPVTKEGHGGQDIGHNFKRFFQSLVVERGKSAGDFNMA